jgi:hypothetical protein
MSQGKGTRRVYTVETDPKGGWRGEAKGFNPSSSQGRQQGRGREADHRGRQEAAQSAGPHQGANGRIQQECTYPRSSGPKRTPG